jgi:hypothetical protein
MSHAVCAIVVLGGVALSGRRAAAQPDPHVGCYRADRPLGTSASADGVPGPIGDRIGEPGPGLRPLATFRLLEAGRVDRPGTVGREWWALGSRWVAAGDTLKVQLSTRTAGWDLRLVLERRSGATVYVGEARYLTDVVLADSGRGGWRPPRVAVRVTREPCAPPPNER